MKAVKDWPGYFVAKNGHIFSNKRHGKITRIGFKEAQGYMVARLCKNGIEKDVKIHRLVAEAFLPNPDNKPYVNHKNSIRHDNRIENLEWCTSQENTLHAISNNRQYLPKGEQHAGAKLTEKEVFSIAQRLRNGERVTSIAESYKVSRRAINSIKSGKSWKHLELSI
jgi:hypothetical protein